MSCLNTAPLSIEQWHQEENDRVRRLRANGLADYADPPRSPSLVPLGPNLQLGIMTLALLGGSAYFLSRYLR